MYMTLIKHACNDEDEWSLPVWINRSRRCLRFIAPAAAVPLLGQVSSIAELTHHFPMPLIHLCDCVYLSSMRSFKHETKLHEAL